MLCVRFALKHMTKTAYQPQTNEHVERYNETIVARLRHYFTEL